MREIRNTVLSDDGRKITGYAIVFNAESVPLHKDGYTFTEIILPEAITQEVIDNSDVLCLLNHNSEKVLGRCNKGSGSLSLELDDKGLRFSLELPDSPLGDEVLSGIKRGDLSTCSFAFTVAEGGEEWSIDENGNYIRIIKEINALFDISVVWQPAYEQTSVVVDTRGLHQLIDENKKNKTITTKMAKRTKRSAEEILDMLTEVLLEEVVEEANEEIVEETEEVVEEANEEEVEVEEEEDRNEEESTDEKEVEECSEEEEVEETETVEEEEIKEENKRKSKRNKRFSTMKEKRFSLISAINDMVANKPMSEATRLVDAEGRKQSRNAGINAGKGICLPLTMPKEERNTVVAGLATYGKENIQTDVYDLLEPLRNNMTLTAAGATILTGLNGNVQIPRYSGANCQWKSEIAAAEDGAGTFDAVTLTPKRLTAFLDVSLEFLQQTTNGAEEILRRDLINCIAEKLESTLLGDEQGTQDKPEGLFYNVTAETDDLTFANIVEMEEELDEANVSNNRKYILSPKAKAYLRSTSKDEGSGRFIMENGEIEGISTDVTNNVVKGGIVLGNWTDYVVANWGSINIVTDPYTKATEGIVRLVCNFYCDGAPRRPESFAKRVMKV